MPTDRVRRRRRSCPAYVRLGFSNLLRVRLDEVNSTSLPRAPVERRAQRRYWDIRVLTHQLILTPQNACLVSQG